MCKVDALAGTYRPRAESTARMSGPSDLRGLVAAGSVDFLQSNLDPFALGLSRAVIFTFAVTTRVICAAGDSACGCERMV